MVDDIEQRIYDLVRPYAGVYVFKRKPVSLTPDTDLDTDLSIDELEIEDLMNDFLSLSIILCNCHRIKGDRS
ncbi:DUF1493 family protein, partial [Yersinia pestis]